MPIRVGGKALPASMSGRALSYQYQPGQAVARNGLGEVVLAGGALVQWVWSVLTIDEYAFLLEDLCGGQASKRWEVAGGTTLYNDRQAEQTFSHCIVLRPTYKEFSASLYREVTLVIDSLY
jgi:hypothetical protein